MLEKVVEAAVDMEKYGMEKRTEKNSYWNIEMFLD